MLCVPQPAPSDPLSVTGQLCEDVPPPGVEAESADGDGAGARWVGSGDDSDTDFDSEEKLGSDEGLVAFEGDSDGGLEGFVEGLPAAPRDATSGWFERAMEGVRGDHDGSYEDEYRSMMKDLGLLRHLGEGAERNARLAALETVFCDLGCECVKGLCRLRDIEPTIDVRVLDLTRSHTSLIVDAMRERAWVSMPSKQFYSMPKCRREEILDHIRECHGGEDAMIGVGAPKFTRLGDDGRRRFRAVAFASADNARPVVHTAQCRSCIDE